MYYARKEEKTKKREQKKIEEVKKIFIYQAWKEVLWVFTFSTYSRAKIKSFFSLCFSLLHQILPQLDTRKIVAPKQWILLHSFKTDI